MNSATGVIIFNFINLILALNIKDFYSNILFLGTVFLPLNFGILLLLPIIY
jgi:hypothetical protein